MGYLHIDNLYKAQEILAFRECYAMEKIHGTSAHVKWSAGRVHFFSGGESAERFRALFDEAALAAKFLERFTAEDVVTIFGEAYGGKQQGMSKTYGVDLRFVAFDVQVGDSWLAVPQAHDLVGHVGLAFVDYVRVPAEIEAFNAERDRPSVQAMRNGVVEPRIREGIVLRPLFEVVLNNGRRVIAKYKREEFAERGRPNVDLDPSRREKLESAETVALEWVTPMRLEHVIDTVLSARDDKTITMRDTPTVIRAMVEDVSREAAGEIEDNEPARKAVAARTVQLFKARVSAIPRSVEGP